MDTVGYIVGEVRTDEFTFVTNREIAPPRLEYIVVQVQAPSGRIDVLAQVVGLAVSSRLLDRTLGYTEVEAILNRLKSSPPIVQGTAKVLGYLDGNSVQFPRHAATPGAPVALAPDELLRKFFSRNIESGIEIGTLINRPNVSVMLDPNGLRRHLAVIAQTGAGKSYTVGVILEKLLQLGGTVVVFDPNSDYVLMRRDTMHRATPFADRVDVFRLPTSQAGRIPDEEIGGSKKFTMQFSKLEVDELCQMTGIAPTSTNIRKAIQTVWDRLQGMDYTPKMFTKELERLAQGAHDLGDPVQDLRPVVGRLRRPWGLRGAGGADGLADVLARSARGVRQQLALRAAHLVGSPGLGAREGAADVELVRLPHADALGAVTRPVRGRQGLRPAALEDRCAAPARPGRRPRHQPASARSR